jgi:opacity protein-like surface antigen
MKSSIKRLLVVAVSAAMLAGAVASAALAGEVKGPPGTPYNTNDTAAPANANSDCAYSGLNDLNPNFGQTVSQVQTAADSFKYYGLAPGVEGTLGLCQGGTNASRQK